MPPDAQMRAVSPTYDKLRETISEGDAKLLMKAHLGEAAAKLKPIREAPAPDLLRSDLPPAEEGGQPVEEPSAAKTLVDADGHTPVDDPNEPLKVVPIAEPNAEQYPVVAAKLFGNPDYFNADLAKEMFPEYAASNEARRDNSDEVQERAAAIRDQAFQARIAEPPKSPDETVTFMAGGTGSGKSTATPRTGIVYDTTLASPESAIRKINEVLATGREVQVNYVFTDPIVALKRAIGRSNEQGRAVPVDTHVATHAGANASIRAIEQVYANDKRVRINVIDNSRAVAHPLSKAPLHDYNSASENAHATIDEARRTGTLNQAGYRAFGGRLDETDLSNRVGEDGERTLSQKGQRIRGVAGESGTDEAPSVLTQTDSNQTPPNGGVSVSVPPLRRRATIT